MKAMVCRRYGSPDVLSLEELDTPSPGDGEVLVRVRASSVNQGDWHILHAEPAILRLMFGLRRPRHPVLGLDVAGTVEAVGSNVTRFRPGDAVFGDTSKRLGGFAEFVCVPETSLAPKPDRVSFEEAAAVPAAAVTALQGLRDKGGIRAGQQVAIQGASGGVGTFAVQIAKAFGAEVTAVCSARNAERVRSIGADHVVDYAREDFTENAERYDLIYAINGFHPISHYKRALRPGGVYVCAGGSGSQFFQAMVAGPWLSMTGDRKMRAYIANPNPKDLAVLHELLEGGGITPVIDRSYPLHQVPEALRYLGEGHSRGKVVITV